MSYQKTVDGHELLWQSNHLGYFDFYKIKEKYNLFRSIFVDRIAFTYATTFRGWRPDCECLKHAAFTRRLSQSGSGQIV
jgi:hypothetical protein